MNNQVLTTNTDHRVPWGLRPGRPEESSGGRAPASGRTYATRVNQAPKQRARAANMPAQATATGATTLLRATLASNGATATRFAQTVLLSLELFVGHF